MASVQVKPDFSNGGVNVTAGQQAASDDNAECKCTKEQWPTIIVILGFVICFLLCLVSILSLMSFNGGVAGVILNVYVCILALLAFSAEMRRFKFCRNIIYTYMKYCYFLTHYVGRGLFYIFVGTIVLDSSPLNIAIGAGTIAFGVIMIGVHLVVGLPNYVDDKAIQEETEYRVAQANEERFRSGETPGAYTPASPKEGGYSTPVVPPPSAAPAPAPQSAYGSSASGRETDYMTKKPERHEDPYEEEDPITPAQRRAQEDARLEAEYYASANGGGAGSSAGFSPTENTRYDDDPFAKDDDTYKPPRF